MRFVYHIEMNVKLVTSRNNVEKEFISEENETTEEFLKRVGEWTQKESDSWY